MDLLIKNARIVGRKSPSDIGIKGGKIVKIGKIRGRARRVINARGMLVSPAFIDPHIHLDKCMIGDEVRPNVSGTLQEAIEIIWERKRRYTKADIVRRAGHVIRQAALNGTTRMRTHVDVDTIGGLKPLEGMLEVRKKFKRLVDLQIVAFPQEGILRDPGTEELLYKAMELGADLVGGMPHHERPYSQARPHIDICFKIAKQFNADIDMHVDETDDPNSRSLEYLAEKTVAEGYQGRVTAGHTCALAAYPDDYAREVIQKVKEAGINMITNPVTNLVIQGREDKQPVRRGITRVKELLGVGVNVTFGQDCVNDAFYPFGKADMLEVANITAHAAHLSTPKEIETVFRMMTYNAARTLGVLDDYGKVGARADLVVIDAASPKDAIRRQPDRRWVIKGGRVIAESKSIRKLR
ncbi:MAG: amidohydrolase family protein [Hadesarchaea archaeon]|nr:amidohydrolase family protein [Hadesarchaea archaeon]